jgi:ribose/xylose/arabinose/galactoside ABC-type transport system permease subunit
MTLIRARILRHHGRTVFAVGALAVLLVIFLSIHPKGASIGVLTAWSNQGAALALLAVGQTIVVFTRGIDLSVGPAMALANCVASVVVDGPPGQVAAGVALVLAIGAMCGAINGLVVVVGRIQPIIATLATGAIYSGLALIVRPAPGGNIDEALSDIVTGNVLGLMPTSLIIVLLLAAGIWGTVWRTQTGRTMLAVGSAESSAYMSGLPVDRAKIGAYALGGLFASLGGLFLGFQTLGGDPSIGLPYTLNSIAAVVVGGTLLTGGAGSVFGSITGALILRTISSLIFFTGLPPQAQPLFEGAVLVIAVGLGVTRVIGIRNRMELYQ